MQPEELRALRKTLGLSQDEIGGAVGLSRVTIGLMERGAAPIEDRTALALRNLDRLYDIAMEANECFQIVNALREGKYSREELAQMLDGALTKIMTITTEAYA